MKFQGKYGIWKMKYGNVGGVEWRYGVITEVWEFKITGGMGNIQENEFIGESDQEWEWEYILTTSDV